MIMREWCLRALVSIFEEHAYSNLYIQKHLHELSEQDRSLAVSIVYGTLQHQRYVRYQWAHMVQQKTDRAAVGHEHLSAALSGCAAGLCDHP